MSLSHYPPGVSGNEPEIAGAVEEVREVECRDGECEWAGVVEVVYTSAATCEWECPVCHREWEEEDDD